MCAMCHACVLTLLAFQNLVMDMSEWQITCRSFNVCSEEGLFCMALPSMGGQQHLGIKC